LKIRIFALARDLGLDSKVLIDICEEAGVKLRNALATISEEERDQIVAFIQNRSGGSDMAVVRDEPVLVREVPDLGKVKPIKTLAPKAKPESSSGEKQSPAEPAVEAAEEEVTSEEEVSSVEAATPDAVAPVEATDEFVEPSETEPAEAIEPAAETIDQPRPAAPEAPKVEAVAPSEVVPQKAPAAPATPIPRPAVSGSNAAQDAARRPKMQIMREMRPIGSVKDREQAQAKPVPSPNRGKPISRPLVAEAPTFTPPTVKKPKAKEDRVQKPDMALSDIVDRRSPLAEQLRQLKDARAEHETGADTTETQKAAREKARRGALLKELKQSRELERQNKKVRRRKRTGTTDLKTAAQISFPITVRALSEAIGRPAKSILGILFKDGQMMTINDELSEEIAMEVAMELGVDLEVKRGRDIEAELLASRDHDDPPEKMLARPPIITILGHVDHGKTTLVDYIRKANVAAGEAGGITQHIAAYQVDYEGHRLTFVDTPGHAAFGEMRARGANVTDIIVLVVAADDGVMPQTVECISHAKSAGVPIIVALNKIDLQGVDEQKILQQLAQHDLLPAEWGGETEVVRTSGATGKGVDKLLETLLLTAELNEFQANPDREALGVCLEAFLDEGRGVLSWLIVQKGTLRVGDVVLCGSSYGRIRAIYNDRDIELEEAGPSMPVKVAGLNEIPGAGDHFFVMKDVEEARETASKRLHEGRTEELSRKGKPRTLEDILSSGREGEGVQELPLILKADTPGSIEALRGEVEKFEHPEVRVQVIHEGVGGVNESDVYLASAAGAIIVAFHVIADDRAEVLAEREAVEIRRYNIIYEVTEQIRLALQGLLRPEKVEVATGRAIVLRTFQISRFGTIAGCRVLNGTISRDNRVHVIRDQKILNDYRIGSLKREKDDAKEVRDGMECGIRLDGFNDVKEGDLLEAYRIDEVRRTLN
jgi:translation initiation factor IF-2